MTVSGFNFDQTIVNENDFSKGEYQLNSADDDTEELGSKKKPAIQTTLQRRLRLLQKGEDRKVLKMTPFDFEFNNSIEMPNLLNQMEKKDDLSVYVQGSQDKDRMDGSDTDRSMPLNSFPKRQLARTTRNF